MAAIVKNIRTEGHLIDSGLMSQIFDVIISDGGTFEVTDFQIGRNNDEFSKASLSVMCDDPVSMNTILLKLSSLGCSIDADNEVVLKPAPADGVVPPDFYSTTNHRTSVRVGGHWLEVKRLRMDGVVVVGSSPGKSMASAETMKFRDVKKDDAVVCGLSGIRVQPDFVERDRTGFSFMADEVSSERKVRLVVERVAELIGSGRKRVVCVCGPVVVHTGGSADLAALIGAGHIHAFLGGNAVAVHDIEHELYGTSLGVDLSIGSLVEMGHRNHLRAINEIWRAGSVAGLVDEGKLDSGIMHSVITSGIPYCLAGSLRDDGPLPETVTDMNEAQDQHARILQGTDIVLMLSSMLHSIAVGNMIPAEVMTICVDINPAVITKLRNRGSHQSIGVVTDVGLFLHLLADRLVRD
ncbi:MAG: TIGR00300 family protein [Candidatus Zixiibacteriota bacterium]|nr:MAG: TIGR00300 family protein [candidate division Zixibacteria bacterium]